VVERPAFFDTHVHFWNLDAEGFAYDWLRPGVEFPLLGRLDRLRVPLYDAEAYDAETRFANVGGVILVEAEATARAVDSPMETRWFAQQAARLPMPVGIVVYADLSAEDAEAQLARHCESLLVRGVRDHTNAEKLQDPRFRRGYALLAQLGLVYDLDSVWEHLASARKLAESIPDVTLVVEHVAFPQARSNEYFKAWAGGMSEVARAPNAVVKISGLGMGDQRWTVDTFRPWVEHAIQSFGPRRSFFGTNWPVDRMYSSYDALINAYAELTAGYSKEEQRAMFFDNASRIYRTPAG
jgi:predicted TIM-barrel fold metal-dependent hydrolase